MKKLIVAIIFFVCYQTQINAQNKTYECTYNQSSIRTYIAQHQTIAIIPMEVNIVDKKFIKDKNSDPSIIEDKEKTFQTNFQNAFYGRLVKMKEKGKLKNVNIQDIDITNKLLFNYGIKNMDDLIEMRYSEIANVLGVDAIFCGEVEIVQHMDKGRAFVFEMITNSHVTTDQSYINLKLRDGEKGLIIWELRQGMGNATLFWKTEKLIQSIFKERLSKDFPYHKKF